MSEKHNSRTIEVEKFHTAEVEKASVEVNNHHAAVLKILKRYHTNRMRPIDQRDTDK